jgi:hypothetical protein
MTARRLNALGGVDQHVEPLNVNFGGSAETLTPMPCQNKAARQPIAGSPDDLKSTSGRHTSGGICARAWRHLADRAIGGMPAQPVG